MAAILLQNNNNFEYLLCGAQEYLSFKNFIDKYSNIIDNQITDVVKCYQDYCISYNAELDLKINNHAKLPWYKILFKQDPINKNNKYLNPLNTDFVIRDYLTVNNRDKIANLSIKLSDSNLAPYFKEKIPYNLYRRYVANDFSVIMPKINGEQ